MKKISKIVEENVFVPRNQLKNMRVFKINDSIGVNKDGTSLTKYIKKMFIDGSNIK